MAKVLYVLVTLKLAFASGQRRGDGRGGSGDGGERPRPPPLMSCFKVGGFGGFDLSGNPTLVDIDGDNVPTLGDMSISSGDNTFVPNVPLPYTAPDGGIQIHELTVQSVCTIVQDAPSAPMCTNVIKLRIGEDCGTARRLQRGSKPPPSNLYDGKKCLEGTINASGIGPNPYVIDGGTGSFMGAFGEFDSVFQANGDSIVLADVKFEVCHYNRDELFNEPIVK